MKNLKEHAVIQRYISWNKFGELLGMDFEIPEKGKVVDTMPIHDIHLATPFAAHGGSVAALIDATLGVACLSQVCEELKVVSTVNLSMNFVAPALKGDVLKAEAAVIRAGKRILFVEGKVYNSENELIATASATMNAYPVAKISEKFS